MRNLKNPLVAIVGPTATGKSQLALHLAQTFDGEIVTADSRQVYHHMNIGTAKPSPEELALVPHHLINIINPDENFSLAQYQGLAYRAISDIQEGNKLALLVGGSGLYIWSVVEGWGIPQVPPNPEFRQSLEEAAKADKDELHQQLMKVDPVSGQRIDPRNIRRVTRAIEVYSSTRVPFSQFQRKQAPPFNILIVGLTADRAELYRRIDVRIDEMIEQGLVEEVKKLVNMGYDFDLPAMSGIGYKRIAMFLRGEMTLSAAIQQIKFETHRFVRHQYNWFQLNDDRIRWFDILNEPDSKITELVAKFIEGE
ncbi:MAG TPA: tRNA (adenosine(37)-N6)-dimethylallyltransferase MiaA [Dehalococcoidia bacterium]|nr:tRNA (adenosine(37)-N6)-dimethylallyltransferase MiaA [Dehalococcoidia bacterium]